MVLNNSQWPLPAVDLSPFDIFLMPTPFGPIPTPFPSIGFRITEIVTNLRWFICGGPGHKMTDKNTNTISGPGPGAVSGTPCGPSGSITGSSALFLPGCIPASRSCVDMSGNNGAGLPNSMGITSPPQIRCATMR